MPDPIWRVTNTAKAWRVVSCFVSCWLCCDPADVRRCRSGSVSFIPPGLGEFSSSILSIFPKHFNVKKYSFTTPRCCFGSSPRVQATSRMFEAKKSYYLAFIFFACFYELGLFWQCLSMGIGRMMFDVRGIRSVVGCACPAAGIRLRKLGTQPALPKTSPLSRLAYTYQTHNARHTTHHQEKTRGRQLSL